VDGYFFLVGMSPVEHLLNSQNLDQGLPIHSDQPSSPDHFGH
jgi:hypothetical protein